jgi:hypothetical protein
VTAQILLLRLEREVGIGSPDFAGQSGKESRSLRTVPEAVMP